MTKNSNGTPEAIEETMEDSDDSTPSPDGSSASTCRKRMIGRVMDQHGLTREEAEEAIDAFS